MDPDNDSITKAFGVSDEKFDRLMDMCASDIDKSESYCDLLTDCMKHVKKDVLDYSGDDFSEYEKYLILVVFTLGKICGKSECRECGSRQSAQYDLPPEIASIINSVRAMHPEAEINIQHMGPGGGSGFAGGAEFTLPGLKVPKINKKESLISRFARFLLRWSEKK